MYATSADFRIKHVQSRKYLSEERTREIFPADPTTDCFIDFVRLRPRISDEIPGERIALSCIFSLGTAKEDAMYNVVSTCAYGMTPNGEQIVEARRLKEETLKSAGAAGTKELDAKAIEFELKNWDLLDAQRIVLDNSFDFIIESVGVYSPDMLVSLACDNIIDRLRRVSNNNPASTASTTTIVSGDSTMPNCFDIILIGEDYTIGKILEYALFTLYFEGAIHRTINYCGFKKVHPHDTDSIIRLAYIAEVDDPSIVGANLKQAAEAAIEIIRNIKRAF